MIDEVEGEQDQLWRDRGTGFTREEAEQAEVNADITVCCLQSAQVENAVAQALHTRIGSGQAGEFQREVGLNARVDFGRTMQINIEATIGELTRQNRLHG